MNLGKLHEPFPAADVEWRLQTAGKNANGFWARALAYITNRAIMERLDEVCGPENWRNEFTAAPIGGVLCGISIRIGDEWVTKWDGAENTDIEAVKGGLSGAMKRAAVQWGIGRYLYNLEEGWATCYPDERKGAFHGATKDKDRFSWDAPILPSWALPGGAGKPTAEPSRPKVQPMEIPKPAQNGAPTAQNDPDKIPESWKPPTFDRNAQLANAIVNKETGEIIGRFTDTKPAKGAHKTQTWRELAESGEKGREYIQWALGKWTDFTPEQRTALQNLLDSFKGSAVDAIKLQDALNRAATLQAIDVDQAARIEDVITEGDSDHMAAALDWLSSQMERAKLGGVR